MRLIDADALEDKLGIGDNDLYIMHILEDAPTVEARPRGKWIEHEDRRWGGVWYTCSNCYQDAPYEQNIYNNWIQKLSDFCPNCGADMRGE